MDKKNSTFVEREQLYQGFAQEVNQNEKMSKAFNDFKRAQ